MGAGRIIVVGNEKGGSGKSTVAMHLIVALLGQGARVASLDLDARQATLTRYIEHRQRKTGLGLKLPLPEHQALNASLDPIGDQQKLTDAILALAERNDVLVIDTPGSDQPLSRTAHSHADVLVTPLNDSLIDLDPLARIDPAKRQVGHPGPYSEMVWDARKQRAMRRQKPTEWFVLRNRLSHLDARNKREMERLLTALAQRIGFKLIPGLSERVIYRELFLDGLTLLDLGGHRTSLTLSQVTARQELRRMIDALGLTELGVIKAVEASL
ncbi:MAG TPA: division plane positioning ATPase MipZ [Magnetospirillaceae bacterium]|jgi:chromosome partitioning protein